MAEALIQLEDRDNIRGETVAVSMEEVVGLDHRVPCIIGGKVAHGHKVPKVLKAQEVLKVFRENKEYKDQSAHKEFKVK